MSVQIGRGLSTLIGDVGGELEALAPGAAKKGFGRIPVVAATRTAAGLRGTLRDDARATVARLAATPADGDAPTGPVVLVVAGPSVRHDGWPHDQQPDRPKDRRRETARGLFGRRTVPCPICQQELVKSENKMDHWIGHARPIPSGAGAGCFTWRCVCGPADMIWEKDHQAGAALAVHMMQRHSLSI